MTSHHPTSPAVSIIIVNYFSADCLEKCLSHLLQARPKGGMEIIVVNNSPGEPLDDLQAAHPQIILIKAEENLGFGPACNLGFSKARGKFVLLINPDAFIEPEAVNQAISYMQDHPRVGVVGGQLVDEEGNWQPSARMFPTFFDKFFMLSGLAARFEKNRVLGRMDMTWWDHMEPREVDWVVGAFFMVRAEVFKALGGFDPRYFLYYEELELCRRVKAYGFEVHYVPSIRVHHIGGASSDGDHMDDNAVLDSQVTLFRLFSEALYYGKYHGKAGPFFMMGLESLWTRLRWLKHRLKRSPASKEKAGQFSRHIKKIKLALRETNYGQKAPKRHWDLKLESYDHWSEE